ncbi:MAG: 50S ribosomal protein L10 [Candidatus Magasanikbacteria bacterium]|nr:50S ribosomal protein L10 [Candidatus Magasanikbacteria bacterium]
MAKTKQAKEQAMQTLLSGIKEAKSVVFANFQGLTVSQSEELRAKCREQKIRYMATKKTLLGRALSGLGMQVDTKAFQGGVAVVWGLEDEVAPAQIIAGYAKTHEVVSIFGGILEKTYIDAAKVAELSALPSKRELYAKLLGSLNAPVSGFVNVLAGNLRGLVQVLNAIKDSKV